MNTFSITVFFNRIVSLGGISYVCFHIILYASLILTGMFVLRVHARKDVSKRDWLKAWGISLLMWIWMCVEWAIFEVYLAVPYEVSIAVLVIGLAGICALGRPVAKRIQGSGKEI